LRSKKFFKFGVSGIAFFENLFYNPAPHLKIEFNRDEFGSVPSSIESCLNMLKPFSNSRS
jgi:hypothetical protein